MTEVLDVMKEIVIISCCLHLPDPPLLPYSPNINIYTTPSYCQLFFSICLTPSTLPDWPKIPRKNINLSKRWVSKNIFVFALFGKHFCHCCQHLSYHPPPFVIKCQHLPNQRWAITLARVSITGITPCFLVLIPVSISRPWSEKSWLQSLYEHSIFESLDSSLNIMTKISKTLIPVLILRFNYKKSSFQVWWPDLTLEFLTSV